MNETRYLPLAQIEASADVQARAGMSEEAIEDYADVFREKRELPPVVVYFDEKTYWLADGFHRLAAAKLAGLRRIKAEVRRGDQRSALLHSASSNTTHGLRRSNADKRRAVGVLLADEEWAKWSNREIARRCSVSESFVRSVRESICAPCADAPGPRMVERDGQTYEMDTAGIGKPVAPERLSEGFASGETWDCQHCQRVNPVECPTCGDCGEPQPGTGRIEENSLAVEANSPVSEPLPVAEPAQAVSPERPPALARPSGPPAPVTEQVHDQKGQPVPDGLVEAFCTLTEFRSLVQLIGSAKKRVDALGANGSRPGAEVLRADVVTADLDNAQKGLRFAMPYVICPKCQGRRCHGKDSPCNGLGWLREDQYHRLPVEQKHGGEVPGQAA